MSRPKKSSINSVKMTQISISLPDDLIKQIDAMAATDNRNRSNYIVNVMRKLVEEGK